MLVLTSTPQNIIIITLPDGREVEVHGPPDTYVKIGFQADRDIQISRRNKGEPKQ